MTHFCARCRRPLSRPPVLVAGLGYGSTCATKVQEADLLTPAPRPVTARRTRTRRETRQMALEVMA